MAATSAEGQVLRVVLDNNRPFGLQNLVDLTAHLGLKKAQVTKAIDVLVEQGKIVAKEFGKTKVYIPPQAGLAVLSKEESDAKRARCRELQEQLQAEAAQSKEVETELAQLKNAATEEQILQQTAECTKKLKDLEARLGALRSGAVLVTKAEREAVEEALVAALEAWRKRKAMFRNIWGDLSEGIEGKQSDLFEEIGIETDEAVGADMALIERDLMPKKRRMR